MNYYRIYPINTDRRIIDVPYALELPGDDEARTYAAGLLSPDRGAEIWQADRLVCQVAPSSHLKERESSYATRSLR